MDESWAQHRELVAEALSRSGPGYVAAFESAAAVHGLPVLGAPPARAELIRPGTTGGRQDDRRRVRALPLDDDEVTVVDGMRVTTVARTLMDLAAGSDRETAVVAGDAALRRGLCSMADVAVCLDRHPNRQGRRGAEFLVAFADGGARSPAASASRLLIWQHGLLPRPAIDVEVRGFFDDPLGRADFYWDDGRTLGVVDDGPASPPLLAPEVLAELDQLGVRVVRWATEELRAPAPRLRGPDGVLGRLHDALDRRVPRPWPCAFRYVETLRGA